jgi:hypothetical protein
MRLKELRMDWKVVTAILVSTLMLAIEHYHRILAHTSYDRMLLYLGVPLLVVLFIFRESPAKYGFQIGDWKAGLALTAVGCGGMALVVALVARTGEFREYYALRATPAIPVPLNTALDLFGWEFLRSTPSVGHTPFCFRPFPSPSHTLASRSLRR